MTKKFFYFMRFSYNKLPNQEKRSVVKTFQCFFRKNLTDKESEVTGERMREEIGSLGRTCTH